MASSISETGSQRALPAVASQTIVVARKWSCAMSPARPQRSERPATYADIEALPPHVVGEILFGVLHTQARPSPRHGLGANSLSFEMTGPFQFGRGGPGGWVFIIEPELHLGSHVVVPDIAAWRRERLTPFPETAFIETPPDWIAEVMSPSTQAVDRTDKLAIYRAFGVGHCWYVDPILKMLEVLVLEGASAGAGSAPEAQQKSAGAGSAPEAQQKGAGAGSAPEAQQKSAGAGSAPEAQQKGAGAGSAPEPPSRWVIFATFKNNDPVTAPPFEAHTFALDVLWPADIVG
ncbi:MAG: Uma2 family endonuclease [Hyphomicrobiaceae bacterium]|nr:Uma2 family endonuclease [Hyphomicrobiaceae bacterium]